MSGVEMTPELFRQMLPEPFITVDPGDTVIVCLSGTWEMEQVNSMGTYLERWAPQVNWRAIHEPGFVGVLHVRKDPGQVRQDPAEPIEPTTPL